MKKFILLAAAAVSLTACNTEDKYIDEPVAAQISATIGGNTMSRASDVTWDKGDNIGISVSDRYLNIKYTTENGDGIFDGTTIYFRNKVSPETLIAYYPFSGTEGQAPSVIEVSTGAERQTPDEQPKFDFLYAIKENVTGADPNVIFTFSHRMSKLTFIFENGNDGTDVSKITSCEISGLILDGTFNPSTGDCLANATASTDVLSLPPTPKDDKMVLSPIIFPQTVGKVTMKIKDSEAQEYSCDLKFNHNRLESGNNYLYTIIVNKTSLIVNPCEITEWTVIDTDPDDPDKPLGSEAVSE